MQGFIKFCEKKENLFENIPHKGTKAQREEEYKEKNKNQRMDTNKERITRIKKIKVGAFLIVDSLHSFLILFLILVPLYLGAFVCYYSLVKYEQLSVQN
jgi:hypothetical protein